MAASCTYVVYQSNIRYLWYGFDNRQFLIQHAGLKLIRLIMPDAYVQSLLLLLWGTAAAAKYGDAGSSWHTSRNLRQRQTDHVFPDTPFHVYEGTHLLDQSLFLWAVTMVNSN
jgi:hypothetical protein